MSFSSFFSEQARKPSGVFGRWVMSVVFNQGNALLNGFVEELMSVQATDRILEIGFGTGKLIHDLAKKIDKGYIEGIEFSGSMISIATRRNRKSIADGTIRLIEGDFDEMTIEKNRYTKICTTNTIYFWPDARHTANKMADLLVPNGKVFIAFEDKKQLEKRNLDENVFSLYSKDEVRDLLLDAGFSPDVRIETREKRELLYHCAIATK
jgi:ubiquinone/menaquinone biosynthesis C-methylase UbiE